MSVPATPTETTSLWSDARCELLPASRAGTPSPVTASKRDAECTPAALALNCISFRLKPPAANDTPKTSSRFPMIEPTNDALTTSKLPASTSSTATISSVTLPNVALSRPPRRGPTRIASWSVARPIRPASGMMASPEVMKISND